jgi:Fe-S oxidoreductase
MPGTRELAKFAAGMPSQRSIPQFDPEPFTRWFAERQNQAPGEMGKVLLFPDTFNNYFFPQTARAAVEVLEHLGYEVVVPNQYICCGRPLYDYGFLDMAERYLLNVLKVLQPAVQQKTPIVVLEPSCWSVLRDELHQLFPDRTDAQALMGNTFLFGEFLEKHADLPRLPRLHADVLMHAHCHHKSLIKKASHEEAILKNMGADFHQVTSGCCGMAGSFGFEKDKYQVSVDVGEHGLIPAIRKAGLNTILLADGFSCREQVSQMTNRHALHLAEVVDLAIKQDGTAPGKYPETPYVAQHRDAVRKSKLRSGIILAAATAALSVGIWFKKRKRRQ